MEASHGGRPVTGARSPVAPGAHGTCSPLLCGLNRSRSCHPLAAASQRRSERARCCPEPRKRPFVPLLKSSLERRSISECHQLRRTRESSGSYRAAPSPVTERRMSLLRGAAAGAQSKQEREERGTEHHGAPAGQPAATSTTQATALARGSGNTTGLQRLVWRRLPRWREFTLRDE